MAATVSIIILNYRNAPDTLECLESVFRLEYPDFRVIVVDNASPDDSVAQLTGWAAGNVLATHSENEQLRALTWPPIRKPVAIDGTVEQATNSDADARFTLLVSPKNNGFAAGNNLGISHALQHHQPDYIWLLNNDTTVPRNALSALVADWENRAVAGGKPGILGSKLRFYDTPELLQGIGSRFFPKRARILQIGTLEPDTGQYDDGKTEVDSIIGASIFVAAEFLDTVGLMAEDYFLYYEEIDWGERARRAGYTVGYAPESVVYHKQGASTGNFVKGKKKPSSMFYHYRNLLRFYSKFYPSRWPVAAIVVLLRIVKRAIRGEWGYLKLIFPVFLQRERYRG